LGLFPRPMGEGKGEGAAFTLAEVLITLAIIGVVAAMTIPTLISDYQEKVTVTKVKKVFYLISNAYKMAQAEHGSFDSWGIDSGDYWTENAALIVANKIKPYIRVIDDCGTSNCNGYINGSITFLNGRTDLNPTEAATDMSQNNIYKMRLADGVGLYIRARATEATVLFDINDNKEPNVLEKDIFYFAISPNSVKIPGIGKDPSNTSSSTPWFLCNPAQQGWYCTGWVFYKGNMDYLKCPDELTWNGKNSCK